ncbi:MAG: hypothetical protein ISQ08_02635 [Planctomycetes bacterium]|nr:hypothetical protein [Planctomycetota bacterium]
MRLSTLVPGVLLAAAPLATGAASSVSARQDEPPPLTRVAGSWAVHARTRVVFRDLPERPHSLEVDLAFPGRGRWMLAAEDEGDDRRVLAYLCGQQAWSVPVASSQSAALEGARLRETALTLELRRALLVWPQGLPWEGEGEARVARLGDLGTLHARLSPGAARPHSLSARLPDGTPWESLEGIEWRSEDGAPRAWTLHLGSAPVWTETLEHLDRSRRYRSSFFVPPDRRARRSPEEAVLERLRLPRRAAWIRPVEDWPTADAVEIERAGARASLGTDRTLQEGYGLLLDARGLPQALLFEADGGVPGPQWSDQPATLAAATRLPGSGPDAIRAGLSQLPPSPGGDERLVLWLRPGHAPELRREAPPAGRGSGGGE